MEAYATWVRRFIVYHGTRHPDTMGKPEIASYLSRLATDQHVSASTQNQALNASLFLYRAVLKRDVGVLDGIIRVHTPARLPVALPREEVRVVLAQLTGTAHLIAALLYGSGLRLNECLALGVKDIDFDRCHIVVRQSRAAKIDRRCCPRPLASC